MKLCLLLIPFFFFSCTKSKEPESEAELTQQVEIGQVQEKPSQEEGKECEFVSNLENPKFEVTGYKFQEKEGVTGTFEDLVVNAAQTADNIEEILLTANFEMTEDSLEFGKPARNSNILKGLLKNIPGDKIKGSVTSVDNSAKTVMVGLDWGGSTHSVEMEFEYNGSDLSLRGTIDLLELGFNSAFGELAKLCKVHHMKNGESKTWSDVSILASVPVVKTCK